MLTGKRILFILILTPLWCLATIPSILTEIRDTLDLDIAPSPPPAPFNGYTNILSTMGDYVPKDSDLGRYWTGSNAYLNDLNRIQFVQLVHDTLLAFPHLDFNSPPNESDIKNAFLENHIYMTGISASSELQDYAYSIIRDLRNQSQALETYLNLSSLLLKSKNCDIYWETNSQSINANVLLEKNNYTGPIPAVTDSCQKVFCSTNPIRPYNGFFNISRQAARIQNLLSNLNCSNTSITQGTHNSGKRSMCSLLQSRIRQETNIHAAAIPRNADLSLAAGRTYIQTLNTHIPQLLSIYKTLILLQIDEIITSPAFNVPSLASIYQPPESPVNDCSSPTTSLSATPGINNQRCTPQDPYNPNSNINLYIENLLGVGELKSVIETGLPVGIPDNVFLIGGEYQTFTQRPNNIWKSFRTQNFQAQSFAARFQGQGRTADEYALYISDTEIDNFRVFRAQTLLTFHERRNQFLKKAIELLLSKVSTINIISDIQSQNEKILQYESEANPYRTHQLTLLKDSASWRLNPSNQSWLNSVTTMSNVALLREIAILLAEIKHIDFHIFSNLQKTLLLDVLPLSKYEDTDSLTSFVALMKTELKQYLSGGSGGVASAANMPDMLTSPNVSVLQNRTDQAVRDLEAISPQV